MRIAEISRKTAETDVYVKLNLDGKGDCEISTGIGFLDHMLTLFKKHGRFDLTVKCSGDTEVDYHHSAEDIAICLGEAFSKAIGDKRGIVRYGDIILPMDESLILAAVDISGREYLGFGHEPHISPVLFNHRKIPGACAFKLTHHAVHLLVHIDICRRRLHIIIDVLSCVEFCLEHIATNILKRDKALKMVPRIQYREYIALRPRDNLDKLAQGSIYPYCMEVRLDELVGLEKRKHGLVAVVRKQFTLLCQANGIETMRFENFDSQIRHHRHNHQGHEQMVTSRQFRNQENTCQRRMHNSRHQSCHTNQSEVRFWNIDAQHIERACHHKAKHRAHKQ